MGCAESGNPDVGGGSGHRADVHDVAILKYNLKPIPISGFCVGDSIHGHGGKWPQRRATIPALHVLPGVAVDLHDPDLFGGGFPRYRYFRTIAGDMEFEGLFRYRWRELLGGGGRENTTKQPE